jgi:multiple sugar transport system substrate-binding protein
MCHHDRVRKTARKNWIEKGLILLLFCCLLTVSACSPVKNKNDGVIHLTLWQGINPPSNRDVFQKLVDKFNQTHPKIQVESIYAGQLDLQLPKILSAVVGNVPPDILSFYPQITGQLAELNAIAPLEQWLDKSPLKSKINPNLFGEMELNGHIWSVPLFTSNLGIFYRPKLFEEAGITELPKTWEQLREVARKLTIDRNGDNKPDQYGMLLPLGKEEWVVFCWFPFLLSAGGQLVENNQPNLVTPQAIAALQFWQDLIEDGSAILSPPERGYEEDSFLKGQVAMQITGPWTMIAKSDIDFAVMPMPALVKPATVVGSGNLYVMKTTPEREKAALEFLEYTLGEQFQTEWSIGSGFLPVNTDVAQGEAYQEVAQKKPELQVFLEQMPVAGTRPIVAGYSRISQSIGRAIEAALLGKPVEQSLEKAQKFLDL